MKLCVYFIIYLQLISHFFFKYWWPFIDIIEKYSKYERFMWMETR